MSLDQGRRPLDNTSVTADQHAARIEQSGANTTVARGFAPFIHHLFPDGPPVRLAFWDGSALGPNDGPGTVVVHSREALTRLLGSPGELGVARAYVAGDIDIDGDVFLGLAVLERAMNGGHKPTLGAVLTGAAVAARLGAIRRPPPRPAEELRLSGLRHSKKRDAAAIAHHYDVGNDFYRLVLGPAMTYSCARFERADSSLEEAQRSKHDLICRKLGLHERGSARLLDIGCGWGQMAIHAAREYGAQVVAVTLSESQARAARVRVSEARLDELVEIRLADYRDLRGEKFDAVSSIGMFEHVGRARMDEYFATIHALLAPRGRLLNHAISSPGGSRISGRTFMNRYVFPDGELIDVAEVASAMERAGFELRDVESLREHYRATLHAWVANLDRSWAEAVRLVGEPRARVWRLYMAASANRFEDGRLAIHQVLGVVPTKEGTSAMPRTRAHWSTGAFGEDIAES